MSLKQVQEDGTLTRIRSSFASLLGLFIAPPSIHIQLVFETRTHNTYDVPFWASVIDIIAARTCDILDIDHRKATGSERHEFLYLTVRHRPSGRKLKIAADRTVNVPAEPSSSAPSPSPDSIDNVTILGPPLSETITVFDAIRFLGDPRANLMNSISLIKFTFSEPRPTLLDFCGVLFVLTKHVPKYHPYEFQSYWYAGTAFDVLTAEFSGTSIPGKIEKRCKWGSISISGDLTEGVRSQYRSNFKTNWTATDNHKFEETRRVGMNTGQTGGRAERIEIARTEARAERLEISLAEAAAEIQRLKQKLALAGIADSDSDD